jgi:hypothetical protein
MIVQMNTATRLLGVGALVITVSALAPLAAQSTRPDRFSAMAISQNGPGAAGTVDITVTKWATDADHNRLMNVLIEQGSDKFLKLMEGLPRAGAIAPPGSIGIDLKYARRTPGPGGSEDITIMTNRPIDFAESWYRGRSTDYPFMVAQIHLPPNGKGEGTLTYATKISMYKDTKTLVFENFDSQPIRLTTVERVK